MHKQFTFYLSQSSGEWIATSMGETQNAPGFCFTQRSRQAAIDQACQGIATWMRNNKQTPKSKLIVEKTAKYEAPAQIEGDRPKKVQKFGGIPIRKVTPSQVITVGVEV